MKRRSLSSGVSTALLALMSICAHAQDAAKPTIAPCAGPMNTEGKSRQRFDATPLMIVANELETQGESKFHLQYSPPASECQVEAFDVAGNKIAAIASPFEKGPSTVLYRFLVGRPAGKSEVLVLYNGTAALIAKKGEVIHVSEERDGVISWYAMFRDVPAYPVVKELVGQIVSGAAKPLMAVRWPAGAKEGEIVAYDKRLK